MNLQIPAVDSSPSTTPVSIELSAIQSYVVYSDGRRKGIHVKDIVDLFLVPDEVDTPLLPINCVHYLKKGKTVIVTLEFPSSVRDVVFPNTDVCFRNFDDDRHKFKCQEFKDIEKYSVLVGLTKKFSFDDWAYITSLDDLPPYHLFDYDLENTSKGYGYVMYSSGTVLSNGKWVSDWELNNLKITPRNMYDVVDKWGERYLHKFRVPVPRLLLTCVLGDGDEDRYFLRKSYLHALKTKFTMSQENFSDMLYRFPYSNVDGTEGSICWGSVTSTEVGFTSLQRLTSLVQELFDSPFNSDLDDDKVYTKNIPPSKLNGDGGREIGTLDLFDHLNGKTEFPLDILFDCEVQYEEFIDTLLNRFT